MKRRTLDIIFSVGGLGFAVLLLILGLVMQNQANFAENYVSDQFAEQKISFPPEYTYETEVPGSGCLTEYAGQELSTGKMAECYSNFFIKTHMNKSAADAGVPDETYATMGRVIAGVRADLTAATEAGEDTTELEARVAELNGLRDSMFRGETLRGLLLTTYGFSIFGDRADMAATVSIIGAVLLALLSLAGLAHAFMTPKDKLALVPEELIQHSHEQERV
jgi:hypothetical protein